MTWTVVGVAGALRACRCSAVGAPEELLDRLEGLEPVIGAVAAVGGDLGQVPAPALIGPLGVEVSFHQVRDRCCRLVRASRATPPTLRGSAVQASAGHRRRHRVDRHRPTSRDQIGEHPR
jgi:hypothetical protein